MDSRRPREPHFGDAASMLAFAEALEQYEGPIAGGVDRRQPRTRKLTKAEKKAAKRARRHGTQASTA